MLYTINNYNNTEVELENRSKPCFICNTMTNFVDIYTKLNVCSDECLEQLKEKTDNLSDGKINKW